jgi:uncharacterized membrane protein
MSNSAPVVVPVAPEKTDESSLRSAALVCYGLLLAACVTGITAIAAVILAYIKRSDAGGTVWRSHFRNTIIVFWVLFVAFTAGLVTWPIAFGVSLANDFEWPWVSAFSLPLFFWVIALPVVLIWALYRIVRGLMHASENRAF